MSAVPLQSDLRVILKIHSRANIIRQRGEEGRSCILNGKTYGNDTGVPISGFGAQIIQALGIECSKFLIGT